MSEEMAQHKFCYGKMFPDVVSPVATGLHSGKVFAFEIEDIGLARGTRRVDTDVDAWEECLNCSEFEDCYKLSTGKLLLQTAIRDA